MKLSIIIPVFNEEKTITAVLTQLSKVRLACEKEIIVVDDGSTDTTNMRIKNYGLRGKNIKLITHEKNKGKGEAIKTGLKIATGDYILIQDADLEYSPVEIPRLLMPLLKEKLKRATIAVYGSRFKHNKVIIPPLYLLGNKLLTFITNLLYSTNLTDMETGYKLIPASFCKKIKLKSAHFDIEPEITAQLIKNGIKIIEVPISYKGRTRLAGKKLTMIDAFEAVKTLVSLRFFCAV